MLTLPAPQMVAGRGPSQPGLAPISLSRLAPPWPTPPAEIESGMPKPTEIPRAELHTHLGGAVDPAILWSIAHRQGIRLPTKDYWEFEAMVTMKPGSRNRDLDEMHNRVYHWTELIQSSPDAI